MVIRKIAEISISFTPSKLSNMVEHQGRANFTRNHSHKSIP